MHCPVCQHKLRQLHYHHIIVDICNYCRGIWFEPSELQQYLDNYLLENQDTPDASIQRDDKLLPKFKLTNQSAKNCPQCNIPMQLINFGYDSNVILDRCEICKGLWVNDGKILQLAIHRKGNPKLNRLGKALAGEVQQRDDLYNWLNTIVFTQTQHRPWVNFRLPIIIIPLKDNLPTNIIPYFVIGIILSNIMVFLYQTFYLDNLSIFFNEFGFIPSLAVSGYEYYRFFTSPFIHAGFLHMAGNMLFLWIFGDNLEEYFGRFIFILLYLVFGICGDLSYTYLTQDLNIISIGASGAISGILGAYFVLFPHAQIFTFTIYTIIRLPAIIIIGFWILFQFAIGALYDQMGIIAGINWYAHGGGFLAGIIFTYPIKLARQKAIPRTEI